MKTEKTKFYSLKTKFCWLVLICLFASGVLYPGVFLQNKKEKVQGKKELKSLIKKELLVPPDKTLPPPKRNIFTRQRASAALDEISPFENIQTSVRKKLADEQKPAVEEIRTSVKYIGYVKSGERVVALILVAGESYAVESGDILEAGVTIGKVTPDDMEIFDKGPEPRKINLEGERP